MQNTEKNVRIRNSDESLKKGKRELDLETDTKRGLVWVKCVFGCGTDGNYPYAYFCHTFAVFSGIF